MNPIALVLRELRKDTKAARAARNAVKRVLAMRVRPNAIHRVLLAERSIRSLLTTELARATYWQPMFELLCAEVGEGCRLEICPDSKLPVVDNCELVLGDRVSVTGRTTFSGARLAARTPRIEIGDDTYVGHRVVLRAGRGITIGRHVKIASNVVLAGDPGHPMDPVARRTEPCPEELLGEIIVGDDVWIAEGCDRRQRPHRPRLDRRHPRGGHQKDVPAGMVVGGIPARVIRAAVQGETKRSVG